MARLIGWAGGAVVGLVVLVAAAGGVVPSVLGGAGPAAGCPAGLPAAGAAPAGLSVAQARNAAVIVAVGQRLHVPARGWVIAVATALQESDLINLGDLGRRNDHDSLGLFQQRPSQGWGRPSQIMNPQYAAGRFYQALLGVPGWQTAPLTVAAQAVQRSAWPGAYAKHETRATAIVAALAPDPTLNRSCFTPAGGAVAVMLRAALDQVGDPYVYAATGPDAFDCSGLVVYAWAQAGYRLTVRTAEQMRQIAVPVPAGHERPGDLRFSQFDTPRVPGGAGHVAIVVRPGLVVEAPRSGLAVRIRTYQADASGARFGRLPASAVRPAAPVGAEYPAP